MVASRTRLLQLLLLLLRHVHRRRRLGLPSPPPPSSSSPSWQSQKGGLSLGHSRAADDGAAAIAGVSAGRRIGSGWRVSSIILDFLLLPPRYSAYGYKAPLGGGGAGGVGRRRKPERRRGGATKHQDYMRSTVSGVLSLPTHFVSEKLCFKTIKSNKRRSYAWTLWLGKPCF